MDEWLRDEMQALVEENQKLRARADRSAERLHRVMEFLSRPIWQVLAPDLFTPYDRKEMAQFRPGQVVGQAAGQEVGVADVEKLAKAAAAVQP